MEDVRKGEIALALLKRQTIKDGFHFDRDRIRREFGNASKEIGISVSVDELMEFADSVIDELYEEYRQEETADDNDPRRDRGAHNF